MKKFTIAATVVGVTVMANAASFKWSATGVQDVHGKGLCSGEAVLCAYEYGTSEYTAFVVDTAMMIDGAIASQKFSDDRLVGGTTYNFFYTVAEGCFESCIRTIKAQATATPTIGFGSSGRSICLADVPEQTPEPTSAMLMLLGVAGLALKRKRA